MKNNTMNNTINDTTLELLEQTPKLYSKKCKLSAKVLEYTLSYFHYLFALFILYEIDYFFAIASLLSGYLVMGIVRSKLRNSVIPPKQQEYQYSDSAIATWYMAHIVCLETKPKNKSKEIL